MHFKYMYHTSHIKHRIIDRILYLISTDRFGLQVEFLSINWAMVGTHDVINNKSLFNSKVFEKNNCNIAKDYKDKTRLLFLNQLISNLHDEYNETKKIFEEFNTYGSGTMKCKLHFESLVKSQL